MAPFNGTEEKNASLALVMSAALMQIVLIVCASQLPTAVMASSNGTEGKNVKLG
jgi:hypothetical protein